MIITLNMDTEKDRETCKKVLELVLGFGGSVDLEVVGQPRPVKRLYKDVKGIWPTETDDMKAVNNEPTNEQPKKRRGRPPKAKKDIYQVARERIAERSK